MDALVDRAAQAAARHPAPALRIRDLALMVQQSGAGVSDAVLLAALMGHPRRFRLVDPWRGPWSTLRKDPRATGDPGDSQRRGHPSSLLDGPRLVPAPGGKAWSPGRTAPTMHRMRQTMIRLGWHIDESSPTDLARWHRLVLESTRVRTRLSEVS